MIRIIEGDTTHENQTSSPSVVAQLFLAKVHSVIVYQVLPAFKIVLATMVMFLK